MTLELSSLGSHSTPAPLENFPFFRRGQIRPFSCCFDITDTVSSVFGISYLGELCIYPFGKGFLLHRIMFICRTQTRETEPFSSTGASNND